MTKWPSWPNARGEWTGIITIEDVLEELVGRIGDEFDRERAGQLVSLADALSPGGVVLELRAESMGDAIHQIVVRIPREELPADPQAVIRAVRQRRQAIAFHF